MSIRYFIGIVASKLSSQLTDLEWTQVSGTSSYTYTDTNSHSIPLTNLPNTAKTIQIKASMFGSVEVDADKDGFWPIYYVHPSVSTYSCTGFLNYNHNNKTVSFQFFTSGGAASMTIYGIYYR